MADEIETVEHTAPPNDRDLMREALSLAADDAAEAAAPPAKKKEAKPAKKVEKTAKAKADDAEEESSEDEVEQAKADDADAEVEEQKAETEEDEAEKLDSDKRIILAKLEKKLRREHKEALREAQALKREAEETKSHILGQFNQVESILATALDDLPSFVRRLGATPEQFAHFANQFIAEGLGDDAPEGLRQKTGQTAAQMQIRRLQRQNEEILKMLEEKERNASVAEEQKSAHRELKVEIRSVPEEFKTLSAYAEIDRSAVLDELCKISDREYKETGVRPDPEEVMEALDVQLSKRFAKEKGLYEKLISRSTGATPKTISSSGSGERVEGSKTLSNKAAATRTTRKYDPAKLSDDDLFREAFETMEELEANQHH